MKIDATSYSPAIRALLAEDRLFDLGPGRPNEKVRPTLAGLSAQALFVPDQVRQTDGAEACLAAIWLYHDFLDESHALSQSIDTVEGSYWHGIMHRREPDATNAAYWFRRLGHHPIFDLLAEEAPRLGFQLGSAGWDPFEFIDLCERHRGSATPEEMVLRRLQRKEWELLFEWCFRRAAGRT